MTEAIKVRNLTKIYKMYSKPSDQLKEMLLFNRVKLHKTHEALKDVTFDIMKNQTLGIIGENGSGKSTLLKMIVGTLKPTYGEVIVNGRVSSLLELGAGFNPELTGKENVFLHGTVMGISHQEMQMKYDDIINFADIGDFIDQPVKTYSSGMFVRLAFSCAIHVDPDIMIIDEALSVGDIYFQQKSMKKIRDLKESGKAILFVSHDLQSVMTLCDTVVWLENGKVVEIGPPKKIAKSYQMRLHRKHDSNSLVQKDLKTSIRNNIPNIDKRYGNGEAEIIGIDFSIDGLSTETVVSGDNVVVELIIRVNEVLVSPMIGLTVRDRLSNIVFATNTSQEEIYLDKLQPGSTIVVKFGFSWPHLQSGNYSLSPAIADGTQDSHIMCDWIENAFIVKSTSDKQIIGYIGLDMCDIQYTVEE